MRPLACLMVLPVCAACSGGDNVGPDSPAEEVPTVQGTPSQDDLKRLERLESLGYVAWDSGSDVELKGVTLNEPGAAPGYNLFTDDLLTTFLLDLEGRIVHRWKIESSRPTHCEHSELLDDGMLLSVCVGNSLKLLDRESNLVWSAPVRTHHDVAVHPDGFYVTLFEELRDYQGRPVHFDGIARISARGEPSVVWFSFDHLAELRRYHEPSPLDEALEAGDRPQKRYDYYHMNTLEVLPGTPLGARDPRFRAGNYLVCLRNVNVIMILDQTDFSVVWHWGEGELELPHMPTMLGDGNILLFDNGTYRGYSRVLEIDPATGDIVWSYEGDPPESFFSEWRGSVQRLENGNTLICESERGHVFEVTPEGELVWEFWNPILVEDNRRRIYRFERVSRDRIEAFLDKGSAPNGERDRGLNSE